MGAIRATERIVSDGDLRNRRTLLWRLWPSDGVGAWDTLFERAI